MRALRYSSSTIALLAFSLLLSLVASWAPQTPRSLPLSPPNENGGIQGPSEKSDLDLSRRRVHQRLLGSGLAAVCSVVLAGTNPALAGEVGAKINAAVTKSDLGISVRRSVVKGAQIMDGIDGQWEQFSDRFGLGAARSRQADKPKPKLIPAPQPLDSALVARLLQLSDDVFVGLTKIAYNELDKQIDKVTFTVAPSYERSGLDVQAIDAQNPRNGEDFNFLAYTHYKAYTDLILQQNIDFRKFQKDFEEQMGAKVEALLVPKEEIPVRPVPGKLSDPRVRQDRWAAANARLQRLDAALVQRGLIAQIDMSYDKDDLVDWLDDAIADLQFNIALDGDITLNSQILLQEQGFRLYPNFGRYAIRHALQASLGTPLDITDYYFDTDYNSDPDKFEVKEVLLSIVLESD